MIGAIRSTVAVVSLRFRHTRRKNGDSPHLAALLGGMIAVLSWILIQPTGKGAYHYGRLLAAGDTATVSSVVRSTAITFLILLAAMAVFRGTSNVGRFDSRRRFVAINLPRTAQVASAILYECLFLVSVLAIPVSLSSLAFAAGSRSIAVIPSLVIGSLLLLFLIAVLTYPAGFVVMYVLDSVHAGRTLKIALGFGFMIAYEAFILQRGPVVEFALDTPLRWYGDLLLLSVPGTSPDLVGAMIAAALPIVVFPLSVYASARLADSVWYGTNRVPESEESDTEDDAATPFDRIAERLHASHTGSVVALTWRRTVRSPYALLYAVPAVLGVAAAGYAVISGRSAPATFPALIALLGGMAAGAGFPLNPLGNDAPALPWLLTSPLDPAEYVRGKVLAAASIAVPAVTLLALLATIPTAYTPIQMIAVGVLALVLATGAPMIAVGIGLLAPKYERSEPIRGVRTAVPSRMAVFAFFACLFVCWFPGATGLILASQPHTSQTTAMIAPVAGTLVSVVLAVGSARAGYRFAVERVSRDVVDRTGGTTPTREEIADAFEFPEPMQTVAVVVSVLIAVLGFSVVLTTPVLVVAGRDALSSFLVQSLLSVVAYTSAVVAYLFASGRGRGFLDIVRPERSELVLAAGTLVALFVIQIAGNFVPVESGTDTLAPTLAAEPSISLLVLVPVGALLVAPAEELLFRNVLQKRLGERFPSWVAVAAVSLLFALFHLGTYGGGASARTAVVLSTVFLEALVLGVAYERSGNIVVPIIAHGCYNLMAFSLLVVTVPT